MARFNQNTQPRKVVTNRAGGAAYDHSNKEKIATLLLTSFLQDQFYRSGSETLNELIALTQAEPKFAAKAAIFARNEHGMRSVSHAVSGVVAETVKGEPWTKNFFREVVRRPDDITEALSFYFGRGNKSVPNAMKKGFGSALTGFDEYQLGKYKASKKEVSLVDAVNLLHPKHTVALKKLVDGTLKAPTTFETQLSKAGKASNVKEAKAEAWEGLVKTGKISYFALLRNMRNIAEQADDETLIAACELLVKENLIAKSKVLPFRFLTACQELEKASIPTRRKTKILNAIEEACDISLQNMMTFPGHSVVIVDTSGSMTSGDIGGSTYVEIAAMFAAALLKSQPDVTLIAFQNTAQVIDIGSTRDSVLSIAKRILSKVSWGGTNHHAPWNLMQRQRIKCDRAFVFSDEQGWSGRNVYRPAQDAYNTYAKAVGCKPKVYSFDLAGYGTTQFNNNAVLLSGFSEKVFDLFEMTETDPKALIKLIDKINLD